MNSPVKRTKKIDFAIEDTQARLKHVEQQIMLMLKAKEVLQEHLNMLQTVRDNKFMT